MRGLLVVLIFGIFLSAPQRAVSETRALLIGVSDYDDSAGVADLKGPANDVRLLSTTLRNRGIDDLIVLADGVEGGARPTRAAILDAFAALAASAQDGDFIYIHLSGHGTRQADRNGDETDGLDEVFLPADTARAEAGAGAIPNAITDDEIGAALHAIRMTGADVWFVLDSCHSGSGTRAATPGTMARFVDPATLGVSVTPAHQVEDATDPAEGPEPPGGFLAFYAAQSTELAREVNFAEAEGGDDWYGLFTSTLAARLQDDAALSFRQLFQAVLSDMNAGHVPGAARLQTPLWEGNLIDAAVFGGRDTSGIRRFAVTDDSVAAGMVHGLAEGTLLGLVADAADPADAVIGFAQVEDPDAAEAFLRPVSADCTPRANALCAIDGALPAEARFAQVIAHPVDLTINLARPRDLATGAPLGDDDPLVRALAEAVTATSDGTGPGVTLADTDADIDVLATDGALWFGLPAQAGESPAGLTWHPDDGPELSAVLARIAKAETLARMLENLSGSGSLLNPSPIKVETLLQPAPIEALAEPGSDVSPRRECRAAYRAASQTAPVALDSGARLKQCDGLAFRAQGATGDTFDVNRVHVDAQFCVHAAHERITGNRNALALGPEMTICSDCPGGYSAGTERLFVVVTEARDNTESLNLEGLVETCDASPTRGAATDPRAFLEDLAKRGDTRGAFGGLGSAGIWVEAWTWQVLPRREAFLRAGRPIKQPERVGTQQDY